MDFWKIFPDLLLRCKETIECFFPSFKRENFTTTITITFPEIKERFGSNAELRDWFLEQGIIKTFDELPRLSCVVTADDWKEFQIVELLAIMYTQSFSNKEHWQKLHDLACEELTRRPERIGTALYIYEKYYKVAVLCHGNHFVKMFKRIIRAERNLEKQMSLWEEVLNNTEETSSVHGIAKEHLDHRKLLAA